MKRDNVALRSGAQLQRHAATGPGVFAFSRVDRQERVEHLVVTNNAETESSATFATGTPGATFTPLWSTGGATPLSAGADGSVTVTVPPFGSAVYKASAAMPASAAAPGITVQPTEVIDFDGAKAIDGQTREAQVFEATLDRSTYAEVTFLRRIDGGAWTYAGTDDNAPYRVTVDTEALEAGSTVEVAAVVDDLNGHKAGAQSAAVTVGEEPVPPTPPVGGLQDYLVVHYPRTANVDDVSLWTFGDIDPTLMAGRSYPDGLEWNGEDEYGVFRYIKLDTSDGKNEQVGLIAVDSAGVKQGTDADRFVEPSLTPEVWLRPDSAEVFTSQAAAQGFATVHYSRPDGAYDGWGLHVFGEALPAGGETQWTAPLPPTGFDEFGAFWRVPVADPTKPLGFIVHKGDEKDPGPDQTFVPAEQASAWVVSGDATVHPTRAAALDLAVLHYNRPAGDYGDYTSSNFADYWGLHTWTGSATPPLAWADAEKPVRQDRFGQVFEVDLVPGATSLSYILHKGDAKDLPADQSLDLVTIGHEVWIISGEEGYLLPVQQGSAEPGDLATSEAHWLTEDLIAWDVDDASRDVRAAHVGRRRARARARRRRRRRAHRAHLGGRLAAGRAGGEVPAPEGLRGAAGARRPRRAGGPQGRPGRLLGQGRGPHGRHRGADPGRARRPLRRRSARRRAGRQLGRRRPDAAPVGPDGEVRDAAPLRRPGRGPARHDDPDGPRRGVGRLVGDRRRRLGPAVLPVRGRGLRGLHR